MKRLILCLVLAFVLMVPALGFGATVNLKATWTEPTTNADGSTLTDLSGNNVYRSDVTPVVKINSTLIPPTSGTSASPYLFSLSLTTSTTLTFYVTAVNSAGTESVPSNTATYVYKTTTTPSAASNFSVTSAP